jgi:hypothetical protein
MGVSRLADNIERGVQERLLEIGVSRFKVKRAQFLLSCHEVWLPDDS